MSSKPKPSCVTIWLEPDFVKILDEMKEEHPYSSRGRLFKLLIREALANRKKKVGEA